MEKSNILEGQKEECKSSKKKFKPCLLSYLGLTYLHIGLWKRRGFQVLLKQCLQDHLKEEQPPHKWKYNLYLLFSPHRPELSALWLWWHKLESMHRLMRSASAELCTLFSQSLKTWIRPDKVFILHLYQLFTNPALLVGKYPVNTLSSFGQIWQFSKSYSMISWNKIQSFSLFFVKGSKNNNNCLYIIFANKDLTKQPTLSY